MAKPKAGTTYRFSLSGRGVAFNFDIHMVGKSSDFDAVTQARAAFAHRALSDLSLGDDTDGLVRDMTLSISADSINASNIISRKPWNPTI
jgi:hypothetical protein